MIRQKFVLGNAAALIPITAERFVLLPIHNGYGTPLLNPEKVVPFCALLDYFLDHLERYILRRQPTELGTVTLLVVTLQSHIDKSTAVLFKMQRPISPRFSLFLVRVNWIVYYPTLLQQLYNCQTPTASMVPELNRFISDSCFHPISQI